MKILHIVPGLEEPTNGIARAAKRIAAEQVALGHDWREVSNTPRQFCSLFASSGVACLID